MGAEDDVEGIKAAWWDVLSRRDWVTASVWNAAVIDILETCPHLPAPAIMLEHCAVVRDELRREDERRRQDLGRVALPSPENRWGGPSAVSAKEAARQRLKDMLERAKIGDKKPRTRAPQGEYQERQRTATVLWKDGVERKVELLDEQHSGRANRWLKTHQPQWTDDEADEFRKRHAELSKPIWGTGE